MSTRQSYAPALLLAISLAWIAAAVMGADAPPVDADAAAALKVLARRVGTWDDEITVKPCKWVVNGSRSKGTTVFKMTQNGRFLRGEGQGIRNQDKQEQTETLTLIATYNVQRKAYLTWAFYAVKAEGVDYWGGGEVPSVGQWDEKNQTMTFDSVDKDRGLTATGSMHWIDNDHVEWGQIIKDGSGEAVFQQSGKSTRRKDK